MRSSIYAFSTQSGFLSMYGHKQSIFLKKNPGTKKKVTKCHYTTYSILILTDLNVIVLKSVLAVCKKRNFRMRL